MEQVSVTQQQPTRSHNKQTISLHIITGLDHFAVQARETFSLEGRTPVTFLEFFLLNSSRPLTLNKSIRLTNLVDLGLLFNHLFHDVSCLPSRKIWLHNFRQSQKSIPVTGL